MKSTSFIILFIFSCLSMRASFANDVQLQREILKLQQQTQLLQTQIDALQKKTMAQKSLVSPSHKKVVTHVKRAKIVQVNHVKRHARKKNAALTVKKHIKAHAKSKKSKIHSANVTVHTLDGHPESVEFYPAALIAENHVVTFVAGMPVVTSPYLGSRPAFDGSDYIVNISSINRDVRLMQQRRQMYRSFDELGYPSPNLPIVAFSGQASPVATVGQLFSGTAQPDVSLGSSELDVAAALNDKVEAYIGVSYQSFPAALTAQRIGNSNFNLNMGFINIGDLDETPFYLTAGQIFVPFGRFSSSMVSMPLTTMLGRTKAVPIILGYKSPKETGLFAALYGFRGDTILGDSGVGGVNLGYLFGFGDVSGEIGGSVISSIDNAGGLQVTGSVPNTTFGGFSSLTNGTEAVYQIPAVDAHLNLSLDRFTFTAEWVGTTRPFRAQDLSYNGRGAQPQAEQLELGMTFMVLDKPSSISVGYQWSQQALALNLPESRVSAVYNVSIWKDTVESLEYRHDFNYGPNQFANGAAPNSLVNQNTIGAGGGTDTLLAQIGVYF